MSEDTKVLSKGSDWTRLLTDPDLVSHLGKLLQTYRDVSPERRETALLQAMREIKDAAIKVREERAKVPEKRRRIYILAQTVCRSSGSIRPGSVRLGSVKPRSVRLGCVETWLRQTRLCQTSLLRLRQFRLHQPRLHRPFHPLIFPVPSLWSKGLRLNRTL